MEMTGSGWIVLWFLVFTFIQPSVASGNQTYTSENDVIHVTASPGTTAILPCEMKRKDPGELVFWLNPKRNRITLDDRRLTSDIRISVERPYMDDWNLYIRDVGVSDSGRYTCVLISDTIIQKDIILNVQDEDVTPEPYPSPEPVIATTQTTENIVVHIRVPVGSTAVLPCQMDTMGGKYKVVWTDSWSTLISYQDRIAPDDPRISVHTWDLHISDVTVEDSGSYTCQMNTNPITTKDVVLIVEEPGTSPMPVTDMPDPMMENDTAHVWFPIGSTAVLPCVIDTQNGSVVVWTGKWSTPISVNDFIYHGDPRFLLVRPYEHTWNLLIANVTAEDSGNYTCQTSADPFTMKTVVLIVGELSTTSMPVTDTPKPTEPTVIHVKIPEGQNAVLPCRMDTMDGTYWVAWADRWSTAISIGDRVIQDDPRIAVLKPSVDTWNLHIANVTTEDGGNYSCQMNTRPLTIRSVVLTVETAPLIVWVEVNAEDDSLGVSCAATGDPTPNVTWYEAGNELPVLGEALRITNISYETQEVVKCVASNELGHSERIFLPGRLYIQQIGPRNAFLRLKMSTRYNDREYVIYNVTAKVYESVDKKETSLETMLKDNAYSMLYGFNTSTKYIVSSNAMSENANAVLAVPALKFSLKPRASTALVVTDAVGQVHESRGPRKKSGQTGPQFVAIDKQNGVDVVINLSSFHRVKVSSHRGVPCPKDECGLLKLYSYKASGVLKHQTSLLFEDDLDFEWAKAHL